MPSKLRADEIEPSSLQKPLQPSHKFSQVCPNPDESTRPGTHNSAGAVYAE